MIKPPDHVKRFHAAKARFLQGALNNFFKREFPKLLGPILRNKLVEELVKLLQDLLPLKEHVKPGQIVWNAVSIKTRADSPNVRLIPVTLTMIDQQDIKQLTSGVQMSEIMKQAIARITMEAYNQGRCFLCATLVCLHGVLEALFRNIENSMRKNKASHYLIPARYKIWAVVSPTNQ